ncbi:MAG: sugar phosphate isomerase/epimerase [Caldilinea sp.]|nr:sugar phosphate isomerase/epimerase [Caldilinea sp.]MDW8440472.1 sugar phosphate isomerase/epimerase [Caldilineaceae bacterium]
MWIGIFAKTFMRPTLAETLDAVIGHGIHSIQFNLACAGLPSLPDRIERSTARSIREASAARNIDMAAVSGTFNMIHPDPEQRRAGVRRLRVLAEASHDLGVEVITLSTGTRDPNNMWRRHPDNDAPEAWRDLVAMMREAVQIAEEHAITLAFEPEVNNVVNTAAKARRLLDEIGSPRLKVVMDGANLFHSGDLPRMREVLEEAFDLLGKDIVLAHAKDLSRDGDAGHEAAGTGLLDYDLYLSLLRRAEYRGPIILHSLSEEQVDSCIEFLRGKGVALTAMEAR